MASKDIAEVDNHVQVDAEHKVADEPLSTKRPKRSASKTSGSLDEAAPRPTKKPGGRAKKSTAGGTEPWEDEMGWTCAPPSLIFRDFNTKPSVKIAGFDLDGTLINTQSIRTVSKGPEDWRFFSAGVTDALRNLEQGGYKIVIFSNQGGIKSALTGKLAATVKGKVERMLQQAGVPALVLIATGSDELRKPSPGLWHRMCQDFNGGVQPDTARCFYVGDEAGRPVDFLDKATGKPSDADKQFSASIGVEFRTPEDVFGPMEGKKSYPAAPGVMATLDSSPNAELLKIFKELSDHYFSVAEDRARFKAVAFRKVASALSSFPQKIGSDSLKEVNAIKGVGKGSMEVIKEYLDKGKVQELEDIRSGGTPGAAGTKAVGSSSQAVTEAPPKSRDAALAEKFM